jgi:hypothetical protein
MRHNKKQDSLILTLLSIISIVGILLLIFKKSPKPTIEEAEERQKPPNPKDFI